MKSTTLQSAPLSIHPFSSSMIHPFSWQCLWLLLVLAYHSKRRRLFLEPPLEILHHSKCAQIPQPLLLGTATVCEQVVSCPSMSKSKFKTAPTPGLVQVDHGATDLHNDLWTKALTRWWRIQRAWEHSCSESKSHRSNDNLNVDCKKQAKQQWASKGYTE